MTKEKWMAVSVVAKKLNVSARTVYRLIEERQLESRKVGVKGCTQVSDESLMIFIGNRRDSD